MSGFGSLSSVWAVLRELGRVAAWVIFSVVLVLLVPSSAWADDTAPLPSSPSVSPSASSSPDSPGDPVPLSPSSSESSPSPSVSPSPVLSPVSPSSVGSCSSEAPCVVSVEQLDGETVAGLWLALGVLVALSAAQLVSAWGRDS